jgi:tripartite-type tricarboxylate transporter receptor subunit TctC
MKDGDAMFKKPNLLCLYLFISLSLLFFGVPVSGQEAFYKGKTVRIIVGFAPGGGFDIYSRTIARHLGRHIPGNPAIVVENMTGAGSLIAANHVYKVARPDGLTIGHFVGGLFLQQLLGKPGVEFDALKFEYVGAPGQDNNVIGLSKAAGITIMEQWLASNTPIKLGSTGGGTTEYIPKILAATIGLPMHLVLGYKGTSDVRLAFNSGEIQGLSNAWESFKATWRAELQSGDLVIVLQNIPKPHPELPNVPVDISFAKTEEARKLIRAVVHTAGPTGRPYVLPPGTAKERVRTLREAFIDTMKDPEFLAETRKASLDINPLDGTELERNVREVFNLDAPLVLKVREILK